MAEARLIGFRMAGDSGLTIDLRGESIEESSRRVRTILTSLDSEPPDWMIDAVPAAASLLILFDPLKVTSEEVREHVRRLRGNVQPSRPTHRHRVPVLYGGESGPDLESVAEAAGITVEEVIRLHSSVEYTVYFLGFLPGFPYLGPLPPLLHCPRLNTPRSRVPAGSVGIADDRTGIYPQSSPGGWRLIGVTPVHLFNPIADPPALVSPGDLVTFYAVDEGEYEDLRAHPEAQWRR